MQRLRVTPTQARRLALLRQRLAGERPAATASSMIALFRDLGCVQIDPLRAVERTQYLVPWSRLGTYDRALLDQLQWQDKTLFEYWAHAASLCLTEHYPIHHYRMRHYTEIGHAWNRRLVAWAQANKPFQQYILDTLRSQGPLVLRDLEDRSAAGTAASSRCASARAVDQRRCDLEYAPHDPDHRFPPRAGDGFGRLGGGAGLHVESRYCGARSVRHA